MRAGAWPKGRREVSERPPPLSFPSVCGLCAPFCLWQDVGAGIASRHSVEGGAPEGFVEVASAGALYASIAIA